MSNYLSCPRCGRGPEDSYRGDSLKLKSHPDCCNTIFCEMCEFENMHFKEGKACQFCGSPSIHTLRVVGYIKRLPYGDLTFFPNAN